VNDEDDMLKEIEFSDDFVRIITNHHQFNLDLRKIDKEDIEQVKTFLKKMNFDNCFEMRIVK
jgi:predicted transcriptional regulator